MKMKPSVEDKVNKEYPDFAAEVARLSVEELNARLLRYAKHSEEIDETKEADEKLAQAKELAKELAAPYRDSKKAVQLKMRFLMSLIKDKGGE